MGIVKVGKGGSEVKGVEDRVKKMGLRVVGDGMFGKGREKGVKSVEGGGGVVIDGMVGGKRWYGIGKGGEGDEDDVSE